MFFNCEKKVKIYKSLYFHDRVLNNYNVHMTRNYVFMTIKTHKKTNICFGISHMHASYQKTLTTIDICSERILSFCTLNEHILLLKHDYDTGRSLAQKLSWAHAMVSDDKFLYLSPSNIIITGF